MKPTSEILERIEKCSSEHKDGVFTRLYRYLLREDIYYAAYQKLYANKGATTQGIDNDTADGFSDFYVKELIQSLKDGTYKANPVRREYIPKKNGKLRPLGIPSFRDKLLQEVVRMILEAIYEPVFDSHSHGFRPGKSCHTALRLISFFASAFLPNASALFFRTLFCFFVFDFPKSDSLEYHVISVITVIQRTIHTTDRCC